MIGSPINPGYKDNSHKPSTLSSNSRPKRNYLYLFLGLGVAAVMIIGVVLEFVQQRNDRSSIEQLIERLNVEI